VVTAEPHGDNMTCAGQVLEVVRDLLGLWDGGVEEALGTVWLTIL